MRKFVLARALAITRILPSSAFAAGGLADPFGFSTFLKVSLHFCFFPFPSLQSSRFGATVSSPRAAMFVSCGCRFLDFFLRGRARSRLLHRESGNPRPVFARA